MKLGTLVRHVHGYNMLPQIFCFFLPWDLVIKKGFPGRQEVGKHVWSFLYKQ